MNKKYLLIGILAIALVSCEKKPGIEGLWVVKSVMAGDNEMTPNARWMRFHADSTQESGNGWLQHSVGTWSLDRTKNTLSVVNSNGLDDPNEPFAVTLSENEMTWKRTEEGQALEVRLERSDQLPMKFGDHLYGLWQLDKADGNGAFFSQADEAKGFIFFRWDNRFVIAGPKGRINGVYNVHGHKSEVEMIPYGEEHPRNFWKFEYGENSITLSLLNSDSLVTRTFSRIRSFPE